MNTETKQKLNVNATQPKVFISYCWTNQEYRDRIRLYANRLISNGIKVVIDLYDLKPGQDMYAFMESMVNDPSITHVLAFLNKQYVEKANARQGGVGTESQILSQELYEKIDQTRILPIFCEKEEDGKLVAPTFFKGRIGFDFSSLDAENDNWEQLLRTLAGKPRYVKPALGPLPAFLKDDFVLPDLPTNYAFDRLKPFYATKQSAEDIARMDYEDAAFEFLDKYRIHEEPTQAELSPWDETVQKKLNELIPFRNQFIEWLFLEIRSTTDDKKLAERLKPLVSRMIGFKGRPEDLKAWNDGIGEFDVVDTFLYEIALYMCAMLLRFDRNEVLHELLYSRYFAPLADNLHRRQFCGFHELYCVGYSFHNRNERLKLNRIDMLADWIKEHAVGRYATFTQLSDADGILCLAGMGLSSVMDYWHPRTFVYHRWDEEGVSIFRAARYIEFAHRLSRIFGGKPIEVLKKQVQEALKKHNEYLNRFDMHFAAAIDVSKWGTEE